MDELTLIFQKMHEFSVGDGFVDITECLEEMIRYVANEPSVGLFYIQQHVQNAVPNLINLKGRVMEESHKMTLHTDDLEDSIATVSSMKECGLPIVDDMIGDIKNSLAVMSRARPKRGLIQSPRLGFQMGRNNSWGPLSWSSNDDRGKDTERTAGYLSTVLQSAKQRASSFKLSPHDYRETEAFLVETSRSPEPVVTATVTVAASITHLPLEADELPVSSPVADEQPELHDDGSSPPNQRSFFNYDEFRAKKEAKLNEWLEEEQCTPGDSTTGTLPGSSH